MDTRKSSKERGMKSFEKIVEDHLRLRGFSDVVYEPDGNVPPDFLVDGSIAVETRWLNQNDFTSTPPKGLEEAEFSLVMKLNRLLDRRGPSPETRFIDVRYRRPIPDLRKIATATNAFLDDILAGKVPMKGKRSIADGVELTYESAVAGVGPMFCLGWDDDEDAGGWVIPLLNQNLAWCVLEKSRKVARYRDEYPQWWLVLVAHPLLRLSDRGKNEFRQTTALTHNWDKVIVINDFLNPRDYYEL